MKKLKDIRDEYNTSRKDDSEEIDQEFIAKQLKISTSTVSRYENKNTNPSPEAIVLYSKLFDVSLDYILIDDVKAKTAINARVSEELGINDDVANTLADIHELSKEEYDLTAVLHAFIGNRENTVYLMGIILNYLAKEELYNNSSENDALILSSLLRYINLHVKPQLKDVVQKYIDGQALPDESYFSSYDESEKNGAL